MNDLPKEPDIQYGGCPECGGTDFCYRVGNYYHFTCEKHKVIWDAAESEYFLLDMDINLMPIERLLLDKFHSYRQVSPRYRQSAAEESSRIAKKLVSDRIKKSLVGVDLPVAIGIVLSHYELDPSHYNDYEAILLGELAVQFQVMTEWPHMKNKEWLKSQKGA